MSRLAASCSFQRSTTPFASGRQRRKPAASRLCGRFGLLSDEAFRVSVEGAIEDVLAGGVDCISLTVMHLIGRHQADASVVMLLIVPVEEAAAERLGILGAAEALWELGLVFHGFEVAFRERIVVGRMRPEKTPAART